MWLWTRTTPTNRLGFMLEDTEPPVLLTQQRLLSTLPKHAGEDRLSRS